MNDFVKEIKELLANKKLSYSRCKHLIKSGNEYLLGLLDPKEPTDDMIFGSLYETWLMEGEEEVWKKFYIPAKMPEELNPEEPDFPKKSKVQPLTVKEQRDSWKVEIKKKQEEWKAEYQKLNEKKKPIKSEWLPRIKGMIRVFKNHPVASKLVNMDQSHELQKKIEWEMYGENFLGFIDYFGTASEDIISPLGNKLVKANESYWIDLKKINSVDSAERQINDLKYYLQNYLYNIGLFATDRRFRTVVNGRPVPKPITSYYIFQEDHAPYDITIKIIEDTYAEIAQEELQLAVQRFKEMKENPACFKGYYSEPESVNPWRSMKKGRTHIKLDIQEEINDIYQRKFQADPADMGRGAILPVLKKTEENPVVKKELTTEESEIITNEIKIQDDHSYETVELKDNPFENIEEKKVETDPPKSKPIEKKTIELDPFDFQEIETKSVDDQKKEKVKSKDLDPNKGLFQEESPKTDEQIIKDLARKLFNEKWMINLKKIVADALEIEEMDVDLSEINEYAVAEKKMILDELTGIAKLTKVKV